MKKTIAIIITLFFAAYTASYAQTEDERSAIARQELKQMAETAKKQQTIYAEFSATVDNRQADRTTEYEGHIKVKGDKYQLDIMNTVTYFDGKTSYVWTKDINEAYLSEPDVNDDNEITPTKLWGAYENGYKLRLMGDRKVDGQTCTDIDLYPTEKKSNTVRLRLTIDKKTKQLRQFLQQGKDGIIMTIKFKVIKNNTPLADSEFTFDTKSHPEVNVVDMR